MNEKRRIRLDRAKGIVDPLTELVREGARRLIQESIEGKIRGAPGLLCASSVRAGSSSLWVRNGLLQRRL
ncbi:hypothetical protein MPNT_400003 [Candidatus Methylacidithermus pantelleriae]|uniref:Uncharacterized protein n=1 Tax=Candidatus Methylacidithermus pantelleriae TaxID=2744239 RepID=A0A8J2BRH8_9BACT|nr:hypothetical protein MPNT_400003 [Candidatus Methylacidithermus pantelleriae]